MVDDYKDHIYWDNPNLYEMSFLNTDQYHYYTISKSESERYFDVTYCQCEHSDCRECEPKKYPKITKKKVLKCLKLWIKANKYWCVKILRTTHKIEKYQNLFFDNDMHLRNTEVDSFILKLFVYVSSILSNAKVDVMGQIREWLSQQENIPIFNKSERELNGDPLLVLDDVYIHINCLILTKSYINPVFKNNQDVPDIIHQLISYDEEAEDSNSLTTSSDSSNEEKIVYCSSNTDDSSSLDIDIDKIMKENTDLMRTTQKSSFVFDYDFSISPRETKHRK